MELLLLRRILWVVQDKETFAYTPKYKLFVNILIAFKKEVLVY